VTILENGKVITKKAYGLASLEHRSPFTHNTVVRMPYSEGREFISIATVLMEQQGLLKLDDKVRKYFPKLPAWSEPVTIHDLLNHRSGFVDEWATLLLTQASMQNRIDKNQFLELLYKQPKPEVEPGKGYMYSNSDFGLLRLILEKASGQNLRQWMKKNMFDPLKMEATQLHDDKDAVIPGFAPTYYPFGEGYKIWSSDKTSPGGNYFIATTANDLQKWAAAHADKNSFISKAVTRLFENPQLMPGKDKDYVFGFKEKTFGNTQLLTHQGVNQYTYLSTTKDNKYSIILLSNYSSKLYPYHTNIYTYLLNLDKTVFTNKTFAKEKVTYSIGELERFTGVFIEDDTTTYESFIRKEGDRFELLIQNDSLKMNIDNEIIPLEYINRAIFKDFEYPVYLEFPEAGKNTDKILAHVHQSNTVMTFLRDTSRYWKPPKDELKRFTGKYYSTHLDFFWTIVMTEEGKLVVKRTTISDKPLEPHLQNQFRIGIEKYPGDSFNAWVKFHFNEKGNISHFTVHHPRLMHHRFDRVSEGAEN
ncbi:MAG TPA: serine hydrolase domain-containing protein, partial [Chitinophagaceae bacterium]